MADKFWRLVRLEEDAKRLDRQRRLLVEACDAAIREGDLRLLQPALGIAKETSWAVVSNACERCGLAVQAVSPGCPNVLHPAAAPAPRSVPWEEQTAPGPAVQVADVDGDTGGLR